jgi:glycosyltransferase involved in cell wall biosynthesis
MEECLKRKDIFLALNQAAPYVTFAKVISFSHGLSFRYYPGFYHDFDRLDDQLESMIKDSDQIVVSSSRVKREIVEHHPKIKNKIHVLLYGIPFDMPLILGQRKREKYFLHVGMDHPVKNVEFIIKAFNKIRKVKK